MRMCVWRTTSSPSVVNVIRRCLPFDSTAFTVPPTTCRRAAAAVIFAATSSNPVTTRPASARRSTVAVRKIVSPSGMPPLGARDAPEIAARRSREAGLAKRVGERRLVHGSAVDRLDEERGPPVGPDLTRQCPSEGVARRLGIRLFGAEREELLLAAAEPTRKPTVDEDHERPGHTHRLAALDPLGPGKGGAVRIRGVGRREDEGMRLLRTLARGAEPIDGAGQRELRRAEAPHEVAPTDAAGVLHRL